MQIKIALPLEQVHTYIGIMRRLTAEQNTDLLNLGFISQHVGTSAQKQHQAVAPSALHGQVEMLQPPASGFPTSGSPPSLEAVTCQSCTTSGQMDKKRGESRTAADSPTNWLGLGAFGLLLTVFLQHSGALGFSYNHKQRWGALYVVQGIRLKTKCGMKCEMVGRAVGWALQSQ